MWVEHCIEKQYLQPVLQYRRIFQAVKQHKTRTISSIKNEGVLNCHFKSRGKDKQNRNEDLMDHDPIRRKGKRLNTF